jgi:hypothetical protein
LKVAISLGLMALFIYLFLRGLDLGEARHSLAAALPAWIALSALVNTAAFVIRAWRWRWLLSPVKPRIGLYNLTSTTFIGFMLTFLLPFRVGEIVRPVLLARRERISGSAAIATIALERLLDALTIMLLFLLFVLSPRAHDLMQAAAGGGAAGYLRLGIQATAVMVGILLPIVVILVAVPRRVIGGLERLHRLWPSGPLGHGIEAVERFIEGLAVVRRARALLVCVGLSILMWLVIDLGIWCGTRAFGLPVGFFDTFLLVVPLAVGIAVPTPGGVGSYEYLARISLVGFWGVAAAPAAAAAVTLHLIALVPTILLGLFFMWRDGVRPAEVRSVTRTANAPSGKEGSP